MSKSPKVKKSGERIVHKFASHYIGECIERISEDEIKKSKNPISTRKWIGKLKLSMQRKVSNFSQISFTDESSNRALLEKEIEDLRENVNRQMENVKQQASAEIMKTNYNQTLLSSSASLPEKRFEGKAAAIRSKFEAVADKLSQSVREAEYRGASFQTTVKSIRGQLSTVVNTLLTRQQYREQLHKQQLQQQNATTNTSASSVSTGSASKAKRPLVKNSASQSDRDDAAIDKLLEHLEAN